MKERSRIHRSLAALATYFLATGASCLLVLQLCQQCGRDYLYFDQLALGLIFVILGVLLGVVWLVASRREGANGFRAGALPGLAVGVAIVLVGATRMIVPPELTLIVLALVTIGSGILVGTEILAR
jgi:hypothetical protein